MNLDPFIVRYVSGVHAKMGYQILFTLMNLDPLAACMVPMAALTSLISGCDT
jgi:hypothetical protein